MSEYQEAEEIKRPVGRPPNKPKAVITDAPLNIDNDEFSIFDAIAKVKRDQVDEITYIPADGDPAKTVWNGVNFPAHVPVKVKASQTISTPLPIRTKIGDDWINGIQQPDGTLQTRHVEKQIPMVVLAMRNPRFSVNGEMPVQQKKGSVRLPDDPDKYRGYAMGWMMAATDSNTLEARWEGEAALRQKCGCGESDIQWLTPFLEARRTQLADAA